MTDVPIDLDGTTTEAPVLDADLDLAALPDPQPIERWVWRLPYESPPLTTNKTANPMGASALRKKHAALMTNDLLAVTHPYGWELVDVELIWFRPRAGRADPDNITPTLKPAQDALVEAGLIPDDKARHVLRISARIVERRDDPHPDRGSRVLLVVRRLELTEQGS